MPVYLAYTNSIQFILKHTRLINHLSAFFIRTRKINIKDMRQMALDYHAYPTSEKINVELTTPAETRHDLSRAYSQGGADVLLVFQGLTYYLLNR